MPTDHAPSGRAIDFEAEGNKKGGKGARADSNYKLSGSFMSMLSRSQDGNRVKVAHVVRRFKAITSQITTLEPFNIKRRGMNDESGT